MPDTRARSDGKRPDFTPDAAAECLWLWRRGVPTSDLAGLSGASQAAVEAAIRRALRAEGSEDAAVSAPPFGLLLTWGSSAKAKPTCEDVHPGGPIPAGSSLCCWHCHQSGMDGHPSLVLRPADVGGDEPASDPE